ncbi:MAG: hypothetical protein WCJ67_12550, partial [Thermoleophilia bacterium]
MTHAHLSNDSLIERTLHVWQPRVGRELSREDARQIAENAIGFFSVLAKWSRAETSVDSSNPAIDRHFKTGH